MGTGTLDKSIVHKYEAEKAFWVAEKKRYAEWFAGRRDLNNIPAFNGDRTMFTSPEDAWIKLFQEPHYLYSLGLQGDEFSGMSVLEIGCGPVSGASVFEDSAVWGLDPLYSFYLQCGFRGIWHGMVAGYAENMQLPDNSFDAAISVNAIDHIDDEVRAAQEIERVLKPDGLFAMNVHYHESRICEPIEWNDEKFKRLFSWVKGLRKVDQIDDKAIWRNF